MGAYGEAHDDFRELGVTVRGVTSEDGEAARGMMDDEGLPFEILHSVSLERVEEALGLWVKRGEERSFFQPAQLILRPDGTVARACYQSGPRGRLKPDEALEMLSSMQK